MGFLLSLGATWFVASTEDARSRTAFQTDSQETRLQIQSALNAYIEVVRAGTALLTSNNEINYSEFRAFVTGLRLHDRYPGIEGIGFSQRVYRQDLRSFLRANRLDGVMPFRIWPAGGRPEYHPIIFFEPRANRREGVLGVDMLTDPVQRKAMERAGDTGQPVASARPPTAPPFERSPLPDLVIYIPVYRIKSPIPTVEERRRSLIGFVFGAIRLHGVLDQVAIATPSIAFEIYDENVAGPAALMYRSTEGAEESGFAAIESMSVAGRNWRLALKSTSAPVDALSPVVLRTLLVALLLSLIVYLITRSQVRAWETVARQEAQLRVSEQALRQSESELQHTVAQEREVRTQVEAADRAKDEFLATLSHELRTPLNTVLGWLTMLRTGSMREDQRTHALEVIERNARLQAHLIEDLLDVSRIVMGKVRLALRPLALAPAVSTVLESFRPFAEAKGVTLHAPVAFETATISGDASRIEQIVWNLLSNAIKFTPSGGHVSVELTDDSYHVQVCIRDTGIGIPSEFLPHVFERFRQADSSTTRAHTGVGLGLAIVRDLVELHGGSIEARSEGTGWGASFVVRFPAVVPSAETTPGAVNPARSPALDGVRVLVVDDDSETRDLLSQALARAGAQVTTAESPREAIRQLRTEGADVLVSDIGMPEEDGFSLMRRIRSLPGPPGKIPAIALTAYARPEDRNAALEAGYQLHFAKPVELVQLQAGLVTLTASHASDGAPTENLRF